MGLRSTQLNLLVAIGGHPGIRATDLSGALDLEKSSLSRNLGRLEEAGWVRSEASSDGHRLNLTRSGGQLLRRAQPRWRAAQDRAKELLGARLCRDLYAAFPN